MALRNQQEALGPAEEGEVRSEALEQVLAQLHPPALPLQLGVSEDQLRELFGQFGEIEVVQLPMHSDTGKPKGFAFITFQDSSSVDNVQRCRPHSLDGYVLENMPQSQRYNLNIYYLWNQINLHLLLFQRLTL